MLKLNDIDEIGLPKELSETVTYLKKQITFYAYEDKGANGYVIFGKNNLMNKDVVVKFYYWGGDQENYAEPERLAALEHEAILRILNAAPVNEEWAYFVTPYCSHGDMETFVENHNHGTLKLIDSIISVLGGLSYLHSENYVHRDLKPSNIFCSNNEKLLIGDFGSVKPVASGNFVVSPSNHTLLYRAPETFDENKYYFCSDVYQVGILLYQTLGGLLPYQQMDYLNTSQLRLYNSISDTVERQIFANEIIESRIKRGKILNHNSLPAWIPNSLRKVVRKATHMKMVKRYQSAGEFIAALNSCRNKVKDWRKRGENLLLEGRTSFRITPLYGELFSVQKRRTGDWKNIGSQQAISLNEAISFVEDQGI